MKRIKLNLNLFVLMVVPMVTFNIQLQAQDYPLVYENNFEDGQNMHGFEFTDATAWRLSDTLNNKSLELFNLSKYELPVSSPFNIGVLTQIKVGSFVLEVDVKQTSREYPHRDICLFFNVKDPTNYYYVHISSVADPHAHSIFLVNDEPQTNITSKVSKGVAWGNNWHKVRIERDVKVGMIKVFFDDMSMPIMEAVDKHFDQGFIGFGSFDDTGMFDNIKIWGESVKESGKFFK
ncbi:hypothetical protein [Seonamhaeicola sp.]|uniref:hypothetical protein n=1 Tax=Seonamhaeicola sp. TaxID=1912245 RepID=UPI0026122BCD|nr:hypothetical protein [Seonamhaeicola sp.]